MDEAFILLTLKVKQTLKLIALLLSDSQVGTKPNKQTNKKKTKLYYLQGVDYYIYFLCSKYFHLIRDHYMQFPA